MPSHLTSSRNPFNHLESVTSANRQPRPLLFPPLSEADIQELAADIKANGLENAITIFEDAILDGVNRHKACLIAGVEPTLVPYRSDDPLAFVLSSNLHWQLDRTCGRRHGRDHGALARIEMTA
jgi:hypothetical protein